MTGRQNDRPTQMFEDAVVRNVVELVKAVELDSDGRLDPDCVVLSAHVGRTARKAAPTEPCPGHSNPVCLRTRPDVVFGAPVIELRDDYRHTLSTSYSSTEDFPVIGRPLMTPGSARSQSSNSPPLTIVARATRSRLV